MAPKGARSSVHAMGVAELDVATLDPETFWSKLVAPRKPALIRGHPTDMAWRASSLWTDDYLIAQAGSAELLVEVRGGPGEGYGKGVKRRMSFAAFVRKLAAGDTGLYLTAQQMPAAHDGHRALMAEPLLSLAAAGDFPAAPCLAGHLVPQSMNLWMGSAPEGSSTGLHHDFHDNLYVLLRGTKRFRLYPPGLHPRMATVGRAARMHPNGRIVYEGQGDVLADGSDAAEVERWRRRSGAEAEVAEAEAAVGRGDKGAAARLAAAEEALEAALEAELSDALEDGLGEGEDDFDALEGGSDGEEEDSEEDEEEEEPAGRSRANGKSGAGKGRANGEGPLLVEDEGSTPPSFCRVPIGDPGVSDAAIARQFPDFPGRSAALEVVVRAGSMLYLPAGWFHEVTSFGPSGGPDSGHLAFNYWFHPPDHLDPSRRGFRRPYTSDFWPAVWRARCAAGLPGGIEPGMGAQEAPDRDGGKAEDEADEEDKPHPHLNSPPPHLPPHGALRHSPGGGTAGQDGDLDPPRRPAAAGSHEGEEEEEGEEDQQGGAGAARGGPGGRQVAISLDSLSEEDRARVLDMLAQAQRQRAAVGAMRAFFEKQMRLQAWQRLRSRLPPGRRHHPVIPVAEEVRRWKPPGVAAAASAAGAASSKGRGKGGGREAGVQGNGPTSKRGPAGAANGAKPGKRQR
ncbi:hypothetical protein HYH03_015766 [Edaphochlamys debaryana]|uniref:JmjC domain-containing protein n=1 Tax=Edaphochlamys debaryana TaxID=47281 RepID=A0A835XIT4_9CHLO|nr:hypothetical protein HYH03_015766 [Edaphochlamys debaryana]|eukprot:KAG2485492.1 hypothetical protein HYH03_015766 [Edaphochlamys debaryana]